MKILYGIQLTGNGHLTRSIPIINELKKLGHQVDVITSGNNYNLKIPFDVLSHFNGISLYYDKTGNLSLKQTIKRSNIIKLFRDSKFDCREYDLVISDFEPISAWCSKRHNKKSIGIGNQYNTVNLSTINKILGNFLLKYFVPTDYKISIDYFNSDKTVLPIVDENLLNKQVNDLGFYLIYLPSYSVEKILNEFAFFPEIKYKIYSDEVSKDVTLKNISVLRPDRKKFINDLLNCSGVITGSGFSTTSEALVLGKKLWSIPMKNHYEQKENAKSLKKLGVFTEELSQGNTIKWIFDYKPIDYKWENPKDKIIEKIISIYEN